MRFVQDHQTELPVKQMCELVEVPRSSFYAFVNHQPSARDGADAELIETIREIHSRSLAPMACHACTASYAAPATVSHASRVARLMRANDLVGAHASKKWRRGRPDTGGLVDLLQRSTRPA